MEKPQKIKSFPLQVAKIFREALKFPFRQTWQFWIWVLILCLALFATTIAENYFVLTMLRDLPLRGLAGVSMMLHGISQGLIFTLLAIVCHRMILLGEQRGRWTDFFRWGHRETRFFIWSFLIYIVVILIMMLFLPLVMVSLVILKSGLGSISNYFAIEEIRTMGFRVWTFGVLSIMYFLFLYLLSRVSLVLPATAIDGNPALSWVWDLSTGNGWRLTLIVGTIPFLALVGVFLKFLMALFPTFPILSAVDILGIINVLPSWLIRIGEILFSLLLSIIEIALLSEAYKNLISQKGIPKVPSFPIEDHMPRIW